MSDKMMDQIDVKTLRMLQQDGRTPFKEIAEECNVSLDTIKNRYISLKKRGIIRHSTIVIDPKKMGLGNLVMFGIKIVERYSAIGINELIFFYPFFAPDQIPTFERIAKDTIPTLRRS